MMDDDDDRGRTKVEFDGALSREEAVSYFEAILAGLRRGSMQFRQGDEHLALRVGSKVEIEVRAQRKGDKGKVSFELSWRADRGQLALVEG